jgi:SAM-dependent methyltransferase
MSLPSMEVLVEHFYDEVYRNKDAAFKGILIDQGHLEQITRDSLNPQRSHEQIRMLEHSIGGPIRGKRILEVGCGHGLTIALARLEYGAEAFGIEPGSDEYSGTFAVSQKVLDLASLPRDIVKRAVGEAIPFDDGMFDCVFSSNVLEHVADPEQVIAESLRVLKPNGFVHIVVPNYGSWWEGHYGVLWVPHLPRWLARPYVWLYGRNPSFIDTLQLINPAQLKRILADSETKVEILSWGQDVWEERVESLGFSEWATLGRLKRMVHLLHRLRITSLVIRLGKRLHWETPIILTVQKRASS